MNEEKSKTNVIIVLETSDGTLEGRPTLVRFPKTANIIAKEFITFIEQQTSKKIPYFHEVDSILFDVCEAIIKQGFQFSHDIDSDYHFYRYIYLQWKNAVDEMIEQNKLSHSIYLSVTGRKIDIPTHLLFRARNLFAELDASNVFRKP